MSSRKSNERSRYSEWDSWGAEESPYRRPSPGKVTLTSRLQHNLRENRWQEGAAEMAPGMKPAGGVRPPEGVGSSSASLAEAMPFLSSDRGPGAPEASPFGDGRPLDSSIAAKVGAAYGRDFSNVRVHTDDAANRAAEKENAKAFAIGNHIVFSQGEYKPGTLEGDALIAHELAHTAQQSASSDALTNDLMRKAKAGSAASAAHEQEADRAAVGVIARLYAGVKGFVKDRLIGDGKPVLTQGLSLQRCPRQKEEEKTREVLSEQEKAGDSTKAEITDETIKEETVQKAAKGFEDHYSDIVSAVAALNQRLSPPVELDPDIVSAMVAVETSKGTDAREYDPMQVANEGDYALGVLQSGQEHTDLIVDDDLSRALKDKKTTPWKKDKSKKRGGYWDYSARSDKDRMDASTSVKAGVAWLFHKAAKYEFVTTEEGELLEYTVQSGDIASRLASKLGTTLKVLEKYNKGKDLTKIHPNDELKYKKATQQWKITGWRSWDDAIVAYNGGGDPQYLEKVKAKLEEIKKSRGESDKANDSQTSEGDK